jgi:hypothetical protein
MSRLLVLPMLLSLCPGAALAQDAPPATKSLSVTVKMIAHLPGVSEEVLRLLLNQVAYLKATRETFFSSYGIYDIEGAATNSNLSVTTIVPNRQMILSWYYAYTGDKEPVETDAAAAAVAKVFQDRLQALLYQPAFDNLARQLAEAMEISSTAEDRCAKWSDQLAELGIDDLEAAQQALTGLQQKLLDVELDRRTEEAMQARLQEQMQRSQAERHAQQLRQDILRERIQAANSRVEALKSGEAERGGDFAQRLATVQAEVRDLSTQSDSCNAACNQATSLYNSAADQLTTSTLALQRHLSRKGVLEELIEHKQRAVAEASQRSRQRQRAQREADAARAAADAARARVLELRRQRDALEPVRVEPWK